MRALDITPFTPRSGRRRKALGRGQDLTQIGADRRRAADWVERGSPDDQIEVGAARPERIVAGAPISAQACHQPCSPITTRGSRSSLRRARARTLPSGVSIETQSPLAIVRARAASGCNCTSGCRACLRKLGQRAVLALAEHRGLGVRQDQRKAGREVRARQRADPRLFKIRERRVSVIEERFRREFNLTRRRGEARRIAVGVGLGIFGVARP